GAAVPAQAGVRTTNTFGTWIRSDDFEGSPQNRWSFAGSGHGHFSNNPQWASSGAEYAYLRTGQNDSVRVRTTFYLPSRNMRGCTVNIEVRAVTKDARVMFFVGRPGSIPATGAVIKVVNITPSQGWQVISLTGVPFVWGQQTEFYANLLGWSQPGTGVTDIRVDDFKIQCWT